MREQPWNIIYPILGYTPSMYVMFIVAHQLYIRWFSGTVWWRLSEGCHDVNDVIVTTWRHVMTPWWHHDVTGIDIIHDVTGSDVMIFCLVAMATVTSGDVMTSLWRHHITSWRHPSTNLYQTVPKNHVLYHTPPQRQVTNSSCSFDFWCMLLMKANNSFNSDVKNMFLFIMHICLAIKMQHWWLNLVTMVTK